jgi:hypothetical protein
MDMTFFWSDRFSFFPSHVDPFSLIDTLSFPVDCAEAFSKLYHSYLTIRVLQFLRFHAPFLSTSRLIFEHVYSRRYLSMPILFPRIGPTYSIPIFAPASLPAFFCISWREIPDNEASTQKFLCDGTVFDILPLALVSVSTPLFLCQPIGAQSTGGI